MAWSAGKSLPAAVDRCSMHLFGGQIGPEGVQELQKLAEDEQFERAAASGRAAPPPRATSSTRSSSSSTARAPRPEPHTRGPLRRSATPSKRPCHRLLSTPPTSPQACTRGHSPSSSFSCRLREGRTARMLFVGAPAAGRRAVAGARRTGVRLGRAVHGAAGAAPGAGGGSGRPGGKSSGHQGGDASGLPRAVPRARCSASRRRRAPGGQQP